MQATICSVTLAHAEAASTAHGLVETATVPPGARAHSPVHGTLELSQTLLQPSANGSKMRAHLLQLR